MESADWDNPVIRLGDAMDHARELVAWDTVGDSVTFKEWRESATWDDDSEWPMGDAERVMMWGEW